MDSDAIRMRSAFQPSMMWRKPSPSLADEVLGRHFQSVRRSGGSCGC